MDKTKGNRAITSEKSLNLEAKKDTGEARSGSIWIRDDGAICIDNECVVIQSAKDGAVDFTVDPNKCSCETGSSIYEAILKSALSGKGSRITIKPKEE